MCLWYFNSLKILYNAHALPHLHYCTPVWCNKYPTHLLPLFRIQKKILRIVTKSDYFDHTQPLFKEHNILKLFDINKLHIRIFMYMQLNSGDITLQQLHHNYPTRAREHLRTPQHSLTIFKHSLSYSGPIIWNFIPEQIKTLPTLHSFNKHFKKHLLLQY